MNLEVLQIPNISTLKGGRNKFRKQYIPRIGTKEKKSVHKNVFCTPVSRFISL